MGPGPGVLTVHARMCACVVHVKSVSKGFRVFPFRCFAHFQGHHPDPDPHHLLHADYNFRFSFCSLFLAPSCPSIPLRRLHLCSESLWLPQSTAQTLSPDLPRRCGDQLPLQSASVRSLQDENILSFWWPCPHVS